MPVHSLDTRDVGPARPFKRAASVFRFELRYFGLVILCQFGHLLCEVLRAPSAFARFSVWKLCQFRYASMPVWASCVEEDLDQAAGDGKTDREQTNCKQILFLDSYDWLLRNSLLGRLFCSFSMISDLTAPYWIIGRNPDCWSEVEIIQGRFIPAEFTIVICSIWFMSRT